MKPHVEKTNYFTIPYISSIAKKFIQYFKNISFCKLAFTCYKKLNLFIKVHKDPIPIMARPNVVYKINCLECNTSYVGQTKRTLNTRISEHRNHIRRDSVQSSVITNHRLESGHDFDWDRVEVLDEELNFNKRLISEMIQTYYIQFTVNSFSDHRGYRFPLYLLILFRGRSTIEGVIFKPNYIIIPFSL